MVTFFYRKNTLTMHSIEELFHTIAKSLPIHVEEHIAPFDTNSLSNMCKNVLYARRNQSKINHITGDIHYVLIGLSKKNFNILTIHDCVTLEYVSKANPKFWIYKWLWYDLPIRKVNIVTVISEKTKQEIIKYTNCPESKIRVIPNFVKPIFEYHPKDFNEKCPTILHVGTGKNKNLTRVIEAIKGINCQLNILGVLSEELLQNLKDNQINFKNFFNLSHEDVVKQYNESDLVIFPSTYEGFGMPIIEAQSVGRPVVTSSLEPMLWVSNSSACIVNPFEVISIRNGVLKIIENKSFRENLVQKGLENVERFKLEKVVKAFLNVYNESNTI